MELTIKRGSTALWTHWHACRSASSHRSPGSGQPCAKVARDFSHPALTDARDLPDLPDLPDLRDQCSAPAPTAAMASGRPRRLYDEAMSLARQDVRKLIDIYIRAWTTQDPDLILTVFTPNATYHERVLQQPIRDHTGIRKYWQTKVVAEQANIQAELLSLYLDGTTAIAEWEARFDDVVDGHRKRMREVAILELEGDRVASLREYWTSERVSS